MKKEKYICDNCKEECAHYFHFNDVVIRRANGKKRGRTMGFSELELKDRTFCSYSCLSDFLENKSDLGEFGLRGDLYEPGDQIGVDSPQGKVGK